MAGSAEVGRTEFGIYANTKPFDTTMNGLQAKAESIGKSISRKLAAGLSVAALTKFASDCLYQGSKLNAMRSMSSRAFEGMTDDLNNFAQNAASKFGLSEKMALQFAGTFGTMANSFGFTQKQAYDMSTTLTGLAGDVASFYSMSQEEAFNKLQSVFTGETESLKSLGIVMSQNALDQYALANGFAKTTSQMSEQEKVALRYQFVLSQLSLAQGDFVRTSDAWGNQVKILKLNFQSLQAQIGIGLINVLKPAIKALNVFMAKLIQVATVFAQFTQTIFGKKATAGAKKLAVSAADVGTAAGSAGTGLGSLGTSAGKAAKNTTKAARALKKAQRDMMGFDKMNKLSKKETGTGSGGSGGSGKVGKVGGGGVSAMDFGGMDDGLDENSTKALKLGKAWDALRKACGRLKEAFGGFWALMKSAGKWVLENILKPLGKWTISKFLPKIVDILAAAFRVLTKVLEALEPVWKTLWKVFFKPLAKFTGALIIKALDLIAAALNKIVDFADKHPKAFQKIVVGLLGLLVLKKVSPLLGLVTGKFKLFSRAIQVFGKGNTLSGVSKLGAVLFKRTKVFGKFASIGMKFKKVGTIIATCFRTVGAAIAANPIGTILTAVAIAALLIWKNWDKIKKTKFGKVLIKVGKALKTVASIVKAKALKAFEKIKPVLMFIAKTAIKHLVFRFKVMIATIKLAIATFKKIASYLKGAFKKALNIVLKPLRKISSIWKSIKTKKSTLTTKLAGAKVKTFETLSKAWKAVEDKTAEMKAKIASKWSDLKKKWKNITKNIKTKTADMKAKIASKWSDFKDKWKRLLDNFKGKTAKIKLAFVDKLKKGYNTIAEKIQATRKRWPATKIILPDLHPLAQGGWLEKNTPRLAVVGDNRHEGEIVAPESKLEAMARKVAQESGGSDAQVVALLGQILRAVASVNTNVYLDGREIANNTVRQINQQTRTTGVSPLLV